LPPPAPASAARQRPRCADGITGIGLSHHAHSRISPVLFGPGGAETLRARLAAAAAARPPERKAALTPHVLAAFLRYHATYSGRPAEPKAPLSFFTRHRRGPRSRSQAATLVAMRDRVRLARFARRRLSSSSASSSAASASRNSFTNVG